MNKLSLIFCLIAMSSITHADVDLNVKNVSLAEILNEITTKSDIIFSLDPSVANDRLKLRTQDSLDIESVLEGYNYEKIWNAQGHLNKIIVSGRNGSAVQNFFDIDSSAPLPTDYQGLKPGSIAAISLPFDRFKKMQLGERINLSLPIGQFYVVHDNRFEHENGDITWTFYLEGTGSGYRATITQGENGSIGQILTPSGTYLIESKQGVIWLVDVNASGLKPGSITEDQRLAFNVPSSKSVTTPKTATGSSSSVSNTIDLMVLYTPDMDIKTINTRINYLITLANQAYIDSKVNLKLRLVFKQLVNYTSANDNSLALDDLTQGNGVFANIKSLRNQTGADLVSLIRPFRNSSQKSCGVAWINGSNGGLFYIENGYSVVSDGSDPSSRLYCNDYSLAHELGHNMGSVHDSAHSSFPGKYAFSYGYGFDNKFGTIMSYYKPTVGLFSSPNLICQGMPCGNAKFADNARSFNLSVPTVVKFLPTRK